MFKLLRNFKKIDFLFLTIIVGLIVLQVFLDLRMPEYTGAMVKELSTGSANTSFILQNGGLMLACAFGSLASAILVGLFVSNIASRLTFTLRGKVYDKIQGFSLTEINKFSTASLITRTTNDIMNVQFFIAMGMQALIKAPIMAVWAVTKIVNVSWQWTTATALAICFLIILVLIVTIFAIPKFKKIQTLTDNMNRVTRENLTGLRVIRAANAEQFQNEKFEQCNDALTKNNLFASRVMGIMNPGMNLLISGLSLAIYWIGAYIVDSPAKLGAMTEFMSYAMQVVMAFMLLIMIFILMPRALVSSKRINEVLDTKDSILPGDFKEDKFDGTASVVFENVSFKYPDADEYVLHNISFTANAGETVAFIGSTGSGKSTLINLIPRLYDATEGRVLLDGKDVKEYDFETLNKKIGYVPQRGVLFKGSVKSNVNFGDNNADDAGIKEAISVAQASSFVSKMPEGVESNIAQGGANVSGGQKQRLSIARAIARKPEIFIFDDSFSALDFKTDQKLRAALKKHTKNATKFIVAQRIGTIMDADKIIVLDSGNMVGIGTHEELLKSCPVYQEIALSQFSKEEL